MIVVDGSYLEGGGQIVRTSVGLSALLRKDVRVENIRAKRPKPGLSQQHVCAINAVAELCSAKTTGVFVGSKTIEFFPGRVPIKEEVHVNIPTAGSIGLVLQPLIIAAFGVEGILKIKINGGATFGKWTPSVTYIQKVFCKAIEKFGYEVKIEVLRHGFYPKGKGIVHVEIKHNRTRGAVFDQFCLNGKTYGSSVASTDLKDKKVALRQAESTKKVISETGKFEDIAIDIQYIDSSSTGCGITLWMEGDRFIGASSVGEINKRAEEVGKEAASELIDEYNSEACVDKHLADQIIPFIGLCNGTIKTSEITKHTETNIRVVERFTNKVFDVNKKGKIIATQ